MSLFPTKVLTFTRKQPGRYVRGVFQEGSADTFLASGSLQPDTGFRIKSLMEGMRITKLYCFRTSTEIRAADPKTQTVGDTTIIDNDSFVTFHVKPWQNGLINHYEVYLVRENELS